jgi:hypothetical protein
MAHDIDPRSCPVAIVAEIDYQSGIEDAWSKVATFVPQFLAFLVVLIIGYFVAKAIAKVLDTVLERVGFDALVERGGVKAALERSDYDASDILSKVVFYALMLVVLQMAFGIFGANPVSDLLAGVIAYLPKVFAAILIVVIASAIAAAARELLAATLGGLSYAKTLANGAGIAIVAVGVFAALNQLQIAPAIVNGLFYALLAIVAGSAIIAIGGGGIAPMQQRWQRALQRYDEEKPRMQEQLQGARQRGEARAAARAAEASSNNAGSRTAGARSTTGGL